MSGIYPGRLRQNHQLLFDGTHQGGHAAGGEIRSSDRFPEQGVAAEQQILIRQLQEQHYQQYMQQLYQVQLAQQQVR